MKWWAIVALWLHAIWADLSAADNPVAGDATAADLEATDDAAVEDDPEAKVDGTEACPRECCSSAFATTWPKHLRHMNPNPEATGLTTQQCGEWSLHPSEVTMRLEDSINCGGPCAEQLTSWVTSTELDFGERKSILISPHGTGHLWWTDAQVFEETKIHGKEHTRLWHTFKFGTGEELNYCPEKEIKIEGMKPAVVEASGSRVQLRVQVKVADALFVKDSSITLTFTDFSADSCQKYIYHEGEEALSKCHCEIRFPTTTTTTWHNEAEASAPHEEVAVKDQGAPTHAEVVVAPPPPGEVAAPPPPPPGFPHIKFALVVDVTLQR